MTAAFTQAPRVCGIDLSLTSTGLASNDHPASSRTVKTTGRKSDTLLERTARLKQIVNTIVDYTKTANLVVIEGPSFASQHGSQHDRSGLWWMVVSRLVALDVPIAVMAPTSRAKYVTGKGNANKDTCMLAAAKQWPEFTITGNDTADAVTLMAAGLDHLGWPLTILPDTHRTALKAVPWPDLNCEAKEAS
jgi:Holliday junction resolvasome RuvABC endonuclease subunit